MINILGYSLNQTCPAHPEQYDVYLEGLQVGYLHLRYGEFTVDFPNVDGETVYMAAPIGQGLFDDNERDYYLTEAIKAIHKKLVSIIPDYG